jgi:sulfoxide reductase heme-binding subunit YedZ
MADPTNHIYWITSRAAGTIAMVLASLSVVAGLLMGTRFIRGKRAGDLRVTHEVLSLATLVAIAVHAFVLLGDNFLHPSLGDLLIPFRGQQNEFWFSIGIIGGWLLTILSLSYYVRSYIGQARWRTLHRFTALAWVMAVAHSLGQGTDAGEEWFLILTAVVVFPPAILLIARMLGLGADRSKTPTIGARA